MVHHALGNSVGKADAVHSDGIKIFCAELRHGGRQYFFLAALFALLLCHRPAPSFPTIWHIKSIPQLPQNAKGRVQAAFGTAEAVSPLCFSACFCSCKTSTPENIFKNCFIGPLSAFLFRIQALFCRLAGNERQKTNMYVGNKAKVQKEKTRKTTAHRHFPGFSMVGPAGFEPAQ